MSTRIFEVPVIAVEQPIGIFYIASMSTSQLESICQYDVRRLIESDTEVELYLGIQRKLDPDRVNEIARYVTTVDATFPTSIVIAVNEESVSLEGNLLSFFEDAVGDDGRIVPRSEIARIIDGQHRLAGLRSAGKDFAMTVTVFPSLDIADQAYVFSIVNLAQTKVNKSLVYDLFSYAKTRSPQKTCHNVAVALNTTESSPFYHRIKRIGTATPGRAELITQATVVASLIGYLSADPIRDRDWLLRGRSLERASANNIRLVPFRNLFIDDRDEVIADIVWIYYDSIREFWPRSWSDTSKGQMLRRTNGFRAFMRVLGEAYITLGGTDVFQPSVRDYQRIWDHSGLDDESFTVENFPPGTSGEAKLVEQLRSAIRIFRTRQSP
jgi:DGQHR domain-containing protein